MKKNILFLSFLLAAGLWQNSSACTVIIAGKKATADGSVLNSHTDCGPDNRIRIIPGRTFPKGSLAPVYWGLLDNIRPINDFGEILGYIPQVEKTFTYFHSAYSQINEHQLCIGESTTNQRPELHPLPKILFDFFSLLSFWLF